LVRRHRITDRVSLRTAAHLGTSVLLVDLIGAPAGSTGLFLGLSVLGLDYRVSDAICIVFHPAAIALPIPQVTGAPLMYHQYRMTLGIHFGG
jgi:hypothetical protein